MKNIIVKPTFSFNGIEFGTSRKLVKTVLGPCKEFKKNRFSKNTSDDFGFCHAYYNNDNQLDAIEVFDANIYIDETLVFPCSISELKKIIPDLKQEDNNYYYSKVKSIGITLDNNKVISILFGTLNYYSD